MSWYHGAAICYQAGHWPAPTTWSPEAWPLPQVTDARSPQQLSFSRRRRTSQPSNLHMSVSVAGKTSNSSEPSDFRARSCVKVRAETLGKFLLKIFARNSTIQFRGFSEKFDSFKAQFYSEKQYENSNIFNNKVIYWQVI